MTTRGGTGPAASRSAVMLHPPSREAIGTGGRADRGRGSGRHHDRRGGLEALEGELEAERELPDGDRECRERAKGVLLHDAEDRPITEEV